MEKIFELFYVIFYVAHINLSDTFRTPNWLVHVNQTISSELWICVENVSVFIYSDNFFVGFVCMYQVATICAVI